MAQTIDARVKQKTGTAADFAGYTLLAGEIALVRTSASGPVWNFKVGPGNFDSLDWSLQNPGAAQKADTSTVFPVGVPGLYIPTEDGTYEGVTVDLSVGYVQLIWDGSALVKAEFPIDLAAYAKKDDASPIIWGVGDDQKNVFIWVDDQLETHLKIHPDSWPPPRIPKKLNDAFNFAVSDDKGNVVFGITHDGQYFPPVVQSESGGYVLPKRAYDSIQPGDISKDNIWNQWIEPQGVVDVEGNVWFAGVGETGNLYVTKRTPYGSFRKKIGTILSNLGSFNSDDHNSPCILLDNRPGADYPITVFQCDHNTTPMRFWRFTSLDPTTWDVNDYTTIGSANLAYAQAFRYGDEIYVFARRPQLPRPWRVMYSSDNGDTWGSRDMFEMSSEWLYMLCKEKDNGSGINIACHGHPLNSSDQNIYFMELDFATGELSNPETGQILADIRNAIANPSFTPLEVSSVALPVYESVGTEITRLWDVSRGNSVVTVVFSSNPSSSPTMDNFKSGVYKVVTFSLSDGTVSRNETLGDCGMPVENPKGNNFYVAGACVLDNNHILACAWRNSSWLDGGSNTEPDFGKTTITHYDLADSTSVSIKSLESDLKVIRPYAIKGYDYVLLTECDYYTEYAEFRATALLINKFDFDIK